jgi:solute carrier family 10 (sodium/bile acid cotransporter), member 7
MSNSLSKPLNNQPSFFARNWFLLGLASVLTIGTVAHDPLSMLLEFDWIQSSIVFVVMWMMAIPVPFGLVKNALTRPWPALLASLLNMAFLPILAYCFSFFLNSEMAGGLIVAAALPSTLASSAVFTRKAGGDDTVAILVTLLTNLSCAIITPLWLVALLGEKARSNDPSSSLQLSTMIVTLCWLVLVPIVTAQSMRLSNRVASVANRRRGMLSIACQIGILLMVLFGAIQMGNRLWNANAGGTPLQILLVLSITTLTHMVTLAIGWHLAKWTGIARPQRIAVAISGSQKTLMVGLKLAMDCQVSILPIVIYHVAQLTIDSMIVERWRSGGESTVDTGPK